MWVVIGTEMPVKDDAGNRLERDDKGVPRPVELVPYERFAGLEWDIDDMAQASGRRFLDATLDALGRPKGLSTLAAVDWENAFDMLTSKFVRSVKHTESGKVLSDADLKSFLGEECDWDDVIAILSTFRHHLTLAKSKKKSLRQRFGLPTE